MVGGSISTGNEFRPSIPPRISSSVRCASAFASSLTKMLAPPARISLTTVWISRSALMLCSMGCTTWLSTSAAVAPRYSTPISIVSRTAVGNTSWRMVKVATTPPRMQTTIKRLAAVGLFRNQLAMLLCCMFNPQPRPVRTHLRKDLSDALRSVHLLRGSCLPR